MENYGETPTEIPCLYGSLSNFHISSHSPRPRAADFSQDLQVELSSAGRRRSAVAAQGGKYFKTKREELKVIRRFFKGQSGI